MTEPTRRRGPGPTPRTVHDLVRRYVRHRADAGQLAPSTVPSVSNTLDAFLAAAGKPLDKVTRRDVEGWLGRPGLAASTRRGRLSMLRTFFAWAVENGLVEENPTAGVARIREPRRLPRQLRGDQVDAILEACPDARARLVVLLELAAGLRSVEVARLRLEDIDFAERTMLVRGKGGHERLLPIPGAAWDALVAYLAEHPAATGPLIRSYNDPTAGLCAAVVVHVVGKILRAAGVDDGGHALRHTMAGDMLRRGVDVRTIQTALGHTNLAVTSRYLPSVVTSLREAMDPAWKAGGEPALDAIPALIDTVAALAASVARIEASLDGRTSTAGLLPPSRPASGELVTCPDCGSTARAAYMEHHHLGRHCPDCGRLVGSRGLRFHRFSSHGVRWSPDPAPCDEHPEPHPHTPAGRCLCPQCRQASPTTDHWERPHEKCPDCDGAFVSLERHRRLAHPWTGRRA